MQQDRACVCCGTRSGLLPNNKVAQGREYLFCRECAGLASEVLEKFASQIKGLIPIKSNHKFFFSENHPAGCSICNRMDFTARLVRDSGFGICYDCTPLVFQKNIRLHCSVCHTENVGVIGTRSAPNGPEVLCEKCRFQLESDFEKLARRTGCRFIAIDETPIETKYLELFPVIWMCVNRAVAVDVRDNVLYVAMVDPLDWTSVDDIKAEYPEYAVVRLVCLESAFSQLMLQTYSRDIRDFDDERERTRSKKTRKIKRKLEPNLPKGMQRYRTSATIE